jgi:hypothetical protein
MRAKPDNRRESVVKDLRFNGKRYHISYSERDGKIYECFAHSPKIGTDVDAILATACTVISIALQCGASLEDMEQAALKLEDGSPADIVGAILVTLIEECRGQIV